ncbi:M42 family metallopeptidase [Breznakiella homolactica]|uniref:M20/M25/M40 family metallo-hydrolase n=1 Tax=Breznakiella homolactica TaxID=2798577 RepID=A0A7T8BCI4_9SPIR|nr:M20/M25/M40 family metallo-hydrolase [Breznakiella homolactica]QQO10293.1 M20/M25/M40 family metallo-hydrolase [Breznakiella homolactica]
MDYINRLKDHLRVMADLISVSGMEQEMVRYIAGTAKSAGASVTVNTIGNVTAALEGNSPGPTVFLGAHTDEIGLVVRGISENGFIGFERLGGVADSLLPARDVLVSLKRIPGVIGYKPGHLQSPEDARKVAPITDFFVDVGASSRAEVTALGIRIGDPIVFKSSVTEFPPSSRVAMRGLDDKLGCAVLLVLLEELKDREFPGILHCVFTVQEEVGMKGASVAMHGLEPDYAIAIDTIPVADTPGSVPSEILPLVLGAGPAIVTQNRAGGDYFFQTHPAVESLLCGTAERISVPLQRASMLGFQYATDASALGYANGGIAAGILALPRRYSHSPVEFADLADAGGAVKILKTVIRETGTFNKSFI